MKVSYEQSAAKPHQLPPPSRPELAFIGRSNVGKSSLLNAILNYKGLARTSKTPGRTRMANFFLVNDSFYFVDLPGYGFSATSNDEHADWQELMNVYLTRSVIQRFLFVLDPRRDLNDVDFSLARELMARAPVSLILTKCDKLNRSEQNRRVSELNQQFQARKIQIQSIYCVSSLKKEGFDSLRQDLLES
jgi:GTP-binding protein